MMKFTLPLVILIGLNTLVSAESLRESISKDYDKNLAELFVHFHKNPELSFREFETAKRMAKELRTLGYDVTEGIGQTGVVAVLKNGEGPTVLLRADMDGLPVTEVATMFTSLRWWGAPGNSWKDVISGPELWC
jgi:hippurate hydrolase